MDHKKRTILVRCSDALIALTLLLNLSKWCFFHGLPISVVGGFRYLVWWQVVFKKFSLLVNLSLFSFRADLEVMPVLWNKCPPIGTRALADSFWPPQNMCCSALVILFLLFVGKDQSVHQHARGFQWRNHWRGILVIFLKYVFNTRKKREREREREL